ncbi:MAG: M48 family metalloprotease [bacterium]|nr:M48 family metalloprotease [bacterium]
MVYIPVLVLLFISYIVGIIGGIINQHFGPFWQKTFTTFFEVLQAFVIYYYSDTIVPMIFGARRIGDFEYPWLQAVVRNLAFKAGIPMPRLYIINNNFINAFATGRSPSHSAVVVTKGDFKYLTKQELEAVLAHEIGHLKHRDMLYGTIFAACVSILTTYAYEIASAIIAALPYKIKNIHLLYPLLLYVPVLLMTPFSWFREFRADITGAMLSLKPLELASALEKIAKHYGISKLIPSRTHPPIATRVALLKKFNEQTLSGLPIPKLIY